MFLTDFIRYKPFKEFLNEVHSTKIVPLKCELKNGNLNPSLTGNAYGMAKYKQWGWDIEKQRDIATTNLQKVADELFQHPGYAEAVHWAENRYGDGGIICGRKSLISP